MTTTAPGNSAPPHTPLSDPPRQAALILTEARRLTGPAYRAAAEVLPDSLRRMVGYHAGWWDAQGKPVAMEGKAIRPAFAIACAKAVADGVVADSVLTAAVAVEMVHDFSLLHDDVIDGDVTRRHRATVWKIFGADQAILAGDALLALAMRQMASGEAIRVLADAVRDLCVGQSADVAFADGGVVTLADCLAMAECKTGALLGAACQLGAFAAGAGADVALLYRMFGRETGLAFQLVDDLLGIWGDPAVTGKTAGSDLASRKRSVPVVAALTSGTPAGEELARLYESEGSIDIGRAARLVEAAGGLDWARSEAIRRAQNALRALERARPHAEGANDLCVLADLITRRDY